MSDIQIYEPKSIEKRSFEIITELLGEREFPEEQQGIIKRAIHTSADFDYADNLVFSADGISRGMKALNEGCTIYTDTRMAYAGINGKNLEKLCSRKECFMNDSQVAIEAGKRGVTRATVSMEKAAAEPGKKIFAIGNAPTALIALCELMKTTDFCPELIIGVPVGFVNVVESKELLMTMEVPYIVAAGRKGGSNIAAAICNALMLEALK